MKSCEMEIDGGPVKNGMPPIHPGESLADDLEALEMSPEEFDEVWAVPRGTTHALLEERCGITPEIALRLSHYFGTTARFWMNLQVSYDLKMAEKKVGPQILKEVTPRPDIIEIPDEWEQA